MQSTHENNSFRTVSANKTEHYDKEEKNIIVEEDYYSPYYNNNNISIIE